MVRITIFLEGGNSANFVQSANTVDNSSLLRESFSQLLSQGINTQKIDLVVQPIGSVTQSKKYLQKITADKIDGILLIDLEVPKKKKEEKLKHYAPLDTSKIYFMIQRMEAWILSQPEKIMEYAEKENWGIKTQAKRAIKDNPLIKNKHPEEIIKADNKLKTILSQYFSEVKKSRKRPKPRSYKKSKDGPGLIAILNLEKLKKTFEDVNNLMEYLNDAK